MAKPYEFFEHTADIGVHVYGATLDELFQNAARALYEALGELKKTEIRSQRTVELRAESREDLLHDWLSELLYEVEAHHLLYDEVGSLSVGGIADSGVADLKSRGQESPPTLKIQATLRGSPIDFARSQTSEEIKAVTYHHLQVEELADGTWRATVIFDV